VATTIYQHSPPYVSEYPACPAHSSAPASTWHI